MAIKGRVGDGAPPASEDPKTAGDPGSSLDFDKLRADVDLLLEERKNRGLQDALGLAIDSSVGTYKCNECGTVFEAIHPDKWYPSYGPICCPRHPGRQELVTSLDRLAREPRILVEGSESPRVVPPADPAPGPGNFADVPPAPPHATAGGVTEVPSRVVATPGAPTPGAAPMPAATSGGNA